jgi:hypothetical protein
MASPRRSPGQFRRRPLKVRSGVTSSRGEEVYFTKAQWSKFLKLYLGGKWAAHIMANPSTIG